MNNMTVRNYVIKETLGRGSFGVVYKVSKLNEKKFYVLKQIPLAGMSNNEIEEVKQEATILSSLTCDNIVKYYESFMEGMNLYIIMEFCDGGDLSKFLEIEKKKKKGINEDKIWKFFLQICMGLAYIHKKNILHRDLKTLNIFLTKDDNVRIGDLGVAKILSAQTQFAKTFVGTPYYLSPEMCEEKPYNEKSDIWALGCILYEMITFKHPFEANNPASLCIKILTTQYEPIPKEYSQDMKTILSLLLEKNYLKRPSINEILNNPIVIRVSKKSNIDISNFLNAPNLLGLVDSSADANFRFSEKIRSKETASEKRSLRSNVTEKSAIFKKNSPYYNYDFIARKELANQRERNPKKPSTQARFSKLVGQKQQAPIKLVNKEKNEISNKVKDQNQRSNEIEAKIDNIVKRPVTANVNPNKLINVKNEKKKGFSPKKIKVNINPEKKQESKNINLIISTQQQLHDTLFFLKNDKSDDTKFFQKIMSTEEYEKLFLNKKPEEIKTIRQLVLHSLKDQDIKEDDYEEVLPDFRKDNLVIIDNSLDNVDLLTEFSVNIDNLRNIKENITKSVENNIKDDIVYETRKENENVHPINEKCENGYNRKHTETTDVFDVIQEEVDNFKITDFLNEDCKFRVNVNESESEDDKLNESYNSTIENRENKGLENEYNNETENDSEKNEVVNVVINEKDEEKKQEELKRIKECEEKNEFYKEKCISLVGEKRFKEIYDHYFSLEDV